MARPLRRSGVGQRRDSYGVVCGKGEPARNVNVAARSGNGAKNLSRARLITKLRFGNCARSGPVTGQRHSSQGRYPT